MQRRGASVPAAPVAGVTEVDLTSPRRIHVVGVCGTGMSAYALALAQAGHRVTGSHEAPSPVQERLAAAGIEVFIGHAAENVPVDAELVAASTSSVDDHVELVEARHRGLTPLRRVDLLAALCSQRRAIAVAGTHGKTTTTALTALALRGGGRHPSFVVGADVPSLDHGAWWDDRDDLFVVEADESDGTFLQLPRALAVVTNVEADHLATYGGTLEGLHAAFDRFVAETQGPVILGIDDPGAARLRDLRPDAATYGEAAGSAFRIVDLVTDRLVSRFTVQHPGGSTPVELPVPGRHNAQNATAAIAAAVLVGCDADRVAGALASYRGVHRRFQYRGEVDGVTVVDDFAHLPGEVKPLLAAARRGGWDRIVAVFQPHRYSRTEEVHAEFAGAFADADVLVVTGIYAASEQPRAGITGRLIADASGHPDLTYVEERADLAAAVKAIVRPGDLLVTIGAGDIAHLAFELGVVAPTAVR
jgi:UDP-N-acetylmuramate--alanine ligase